jgi:D-alanine-D-alanine ligase
MNGLVAVIAGGLSHERDVSLASGRNLVRELRAEGVEVAAYDFDRNLLHNLERDKASVALPALHGQFGEDGEIQTLLELIDMPYVGSTSRACRVAFDKGTSRELLRRADIPVPDSVGLSAQTFRDIGPTALMEHVLGRLGERVVVKPSQGGSALGVSGVDGLGELPSALVGTYAYHGDALIERFYQGIDVSVIVLENDEDLVSLDPIAIDFTKGHEFDFAARYTAEFVGLSVPDFSTELLDELRDTARKAHRVLGLRDLSRSDFIVSPDGSFVLLETAVTPGSTETSVFPFACTAAGTSLGAVTKDLVQRAVNRG